MKTTRVPRNVNAFPYSTQQGKSIPRPSAASSRPLTFARRKKGTASCTAPPRSFADARQPGRVLCCSPRVQGRQVGRPAGGPPDQERPAVLGPGRGRTCRHDPAKKHPATHILERCPNKWRDRRIATTAVKCHLDWTGPRERPHPPAAQCGPHDWVTAGRAGSAGSAVAGAASAASAPTAVLRRPCSQGPHQAVDARRGPHAGTEGGLLQGRGTTTKH